MTSTKAVSVVYTPFVYKAVDVFLTEAFTQYNETKGLKYLLAGVFVTILFILAFITYIIWLGLPE